MSEDTITLIIGGAIGFIFSTFSTILGFYLQRSHNRELKKWEDEKRKKWLEQKWPEILKVSEDKNAYILFGDECSFGCVPPFTQLIPPLALM